MRWARVFLFSLSLGALAFPALVDCAVAQQQPQEKRIALVVGDGNYEKAPLPTAANDAGLIAQTLQAAGFDVIGARDLDADALRNSLRDFMVKVQADPANTVAMIYLSGYAVQLAGENYYVPVDAKISRDTDIPTEGLRISDYTRQLASLSVKISVVVLDSAGPQPFVEGGNPIAGGLALVEASPNMLIAFNAAPGTVVPPQTGNYGVYAQALAEMIRTGGLSLPDVFDRVRLRVSESSKGAQVPWDDQKIQAPFTFFDRAPDAPPVQGSPDQVAAIRDKPIRDLGAQDAFTAALARDTFQGYEDFLAAYPRDPLARRVRAILAARREAITWRRTYLADTPDAYWSYLRRYPDGPHAWDARRRLSYLSAALEPPPSFAMIDYGDVPPPPPDDFVYVDRPVLYFDDPQFGFAPPPPPPVFFLPPPPPDFVVLAPPIVAVGIGVGVGLFVLPRPAFVPMPVYCAPPAYVRPPPNNIIYNNIHNTTVINTVINNPAPTPAAIAAAAGPRTGTPGQTTAAPTTLGPTLPTHVQQRATLIQQGKLPAPPSASINPRAPGVTPANLPGNAPRPGTAPVQPGNVPLHQELPKANALPVPGQKGAPPAPPGAAPNRLSNTPAEQGHPNLREEKTAPNAPGAAPNKLTTQPGQPNLREEKGAPNAPGKPPVAQGQPTTPAPQEHERRAPPTAPTAAPSKPTPPPPPPKPETRRAPPPPPPPRAAPPPPPPRAAPPPPPPRAAPPPPRPQPAARPAPPPPRPAPPPPRPAPPKPPPPAAKKCPPNQPRC
ncbi:caspase domain-containing protein [Bradyrhizobium sp.]|uniref:caspase family protein n=1 Tax=Bradyrhizobium sp. TaxID=376 RepID=UPI002D6B38FF|nr:caspase domain-containing protein [Bradyrhizobium sp.]HZR77269.1 caspase domain-containing protein [Bradyrhizobium sp.]